MKTWGWPIGYIILIEIAKIQEEYYQSAKMDRNETLQKLFYYKTLTHIAAKLV